MFSRYLPIALIVLLSTLGFGQSWSGILAPARAVDWTNTGVPGGIPSGSWVNCVTAACNTAFSTPTAANINSACATAPNNTVVRIPAGSFSMSTNIHCNRSSVALRGAGPTQTTLTLNGHNIILGNGTNGQGNAPGGLVLTNLTTLTRGSTVLTVASTTGMVAGQVVAVYEANASYVNPAGFSGNENAAWCPAPTPDFFGCSTRSMAEMVQIVSVDSGTQITIAAPGLFKTYTVGLTPQVLRWDTSGVFSNNGIENIKLVATNTDFAIAFIFCNSCWAKNVTVTNIGRAGVYSFLSYRDEIRDSYISASNSPGAPTEYGIEMDRSFMSKVENNIFFGITSPTVRESDGGNVIAYNYTLNTATDNVFPTLDTHRAHAYGTLYEGNVTSNVDYDDIWGSSSHNTAFRNYVRGMDPNKGNFRRAVQVSGFGRYTNVVANVLGDPTIHTAYECAAVDPGVDTVIYDLGWGNFCSSGSFDATTVSSLMRWGNWDAVTWKANGNTNGIRLCTGSGAGNSACTASETASADPIFPGLASPSTTFPASFYLSSKPLWFGSVAWPPIGPDVACTTNCIANAASHAAMIPAQLCYNNTAKTNGFLTAFDAATCYTSSPFPIVTLSPTSLTFAPQAVGTQSGNQTITLTNTGTATLNIASIVTIGDFVEISDTCTSTLAVSASCAYTVAFFPVASGARSGVTSIVDNASGSPHTISLSGTGTQTSATLTPNPLAFGQHAVGSSVPMLATLTNTGSGVLTLNCGGCGFGLAGSSFAFTSTTCGTQLGSLQSCTMTITFNPSSLGSVSGTLTATNDASSSPQVINLTGIGGTAHYIIGKPGGGTGWGKIGKIPSPPNPPTSYAGRTDNCVTGTEVASGQTPGCIVGATTGKAGSPMSFQYRVTDTNLFADNAPANTAATDPDFGGYVVMATDQTSSSSSSSFNMGSNGGYDAWNRDSTMLLIGKNGGATWVYKVDTAAIHAKTCTPGAPCLTQSAIATGTADCTGGSGNPTTGTTCTHLLQQGDWTFSRKAGDENKLLEEDPSLSKIYILTINAGRTSFQRDVYVDFSSDSPVPCSVLPSNYLVGWSGTFSSGGDGSITKAYGGGGPWVGATHVVSSTETFIYPTVNNAGHRGFQATTTGTTGGSEPNWNSTCNAVGQACTDGTVVWTNIGNLNTQGPGYDVVNYRPGKGCSRLNTRTGRVTRGTGNIEPTGLLTTQDDTICTRMTGSACPAGPPLGTVPLTDRWTLHEAGQPFDSRFVTLSPTGAGAVEAGTISGSSSCSLPSPNNKGTWSSAGNYVNNDLVYYNHVIYVSNTTNTNKQPDINTTDWHLGDALCYTYVWQVASTVVNPCIEIGAASGVGGCSGHSAGGYGFFYKGTSLRSHRWDLPSIAGNANPGKIILPHPIGSADHHSSSRNLDASDSLPFLFFTTEVPTSSTRYDTAGYAEDVGILPDGSAKMFRFNHNYNTGSSAEFAIQNAIGVISQDGKFTAFGSDWMGTRGNKVGGTVTFANGSPIITFSNSLKAGESVQFTSTGTLPTNFALSTTYWVVATGLSTSQFEVSASPGGTAITAGSAGSGTQSIVASTTCNKLRADDSPVKNAVITFGFNILPTINNSGQDIFQSQTACGATCPSTGSTTPNWDNSCPNVGNTCVDGGVTWLNLGPNDCRGDIAVVDLLSSHPLP